MNEVQNKLQNLVGTVKSCDTLATKACLNWLLSSKPPLKSSWLGVAHMALMSGEVDLARSILALFETNSDNELVEKLQYFAMLIEVNEAELALNKANALYQQHPNSPEISHFISTLSLQLGDIELAEQFALKTLAQWPTSGQAWMVLVSSIKCKLDDAVVKDLLAVKKQINATKNPASKSSYFAALSKVYADNGKAITAFEYAQQSNIALQETRHYEHKIDNQNVNFTLSQFTESLEPSKNKISASAQSPIFIIGLPRSGTSLLEQILCTHTNVIGGGEFNGMERASRRLTKGQAIGSHASHFDHDLIAKHATQIRTAYLNYSQQRFGDAGIVIDKSINNNRYLWLIKTIFPESPIIYIKREPLDCAWSCYRTHFSSGLEWSTDLSNIAKHFNLENLLIKSWLDIYPDVIHCMTYEHLSQSPETAIRAFCDFCGLEFQSKMLDFYKNKRPVLTASVSQVREPMHQNAIGKSDDIAPLMQAFIDNFKN